MGWGFLTKKKEARLGLDSSRSDLGVSPYSELETEIRNRTGVGSSLLVNQGIGVGVTSTKHEVPKKPMSIWMLDMSKAYHFTLAISGLNVNKYMKTNKYGTFLPIRDISVTPVSVESTTIQTGIFSDLPLMTRRKIARMHITMNDTDDNLYERLVLQWFDSCVSTTTGYVACMNDIIRTATYVEYNNKGETTATYTFAVMPDGDVTSNRSYEDSELKTFECNLLVMSEIFKKK